jgi:hypothetical protein
LGENTGHCAAASAAAVGLLPRINAFDAEIPFDTPFEGACKDAKKGEKDLRKKQTAAGVFVVY